MRPGRHGPGFFRSPAMRENHPARCACGGASQQAVHHLDELHHRYRLRHIGFRPRLADAFLVALARIGGDEFILILPGENDVARTQEALENARRELANGLPAEGIPVAITFSVGMATYPDHGTDLDALLSRADQAMYRDKQSHGSVRNAPRGQ